MVRTKNARLSESQQRTRITPQMIINNARPSKTQGAQVCKTGTRRRLESLPPSESILRESLDFRTKKLRDMYAKVCERPILQCRSVDIKTLETLGIKKEVEDLVNQIGWKSFFEIDCPAFTELTREFYTTFEFKTPDNLCLDTPGVIRYRLRGQSVSQSITDFNLALGVISEDDVDAEWYINSKVGYGNFFGCGVWSDMSDDPSTYDPSQSSSTFLKKPEWQYIQRFLSFNFIGRKSGSATCSKVELYFIWAMANSVKVNLGYWLADQIKKVMEKKKGLVLGSVITHLAIKHGFLDLEDHSLHKAHDIMPLHLDSLQRMGIIEKKDGIYIVRPPSQPLLSKQVRKLMKRARVEESDLHEDREASGQSTPTCTLADVMLKMDQIAINVSKIQSDLSKMQSDMKAFFEFHSFQPPPSIS